jgi:hypothetical protein
MPTLIYIHGRGKKDSAESEQAKWYAALQEGLARLSPQQIPAIASDQLKLAYWSDIFYPVAPTPANPQGLPPAEQRVIDLLMEPLKVARATGQLAAAHDHQRVLGQFTLPVVDAQSKQAGDDFLRDVIKYFGLGYAAQVRAPFVQLLIDLPLADGLAVVSHSFGTLIAYEVLVTSLDAINAQRQQAGKGPVLVDTLVTMGSPLGWAYDAQRMFPTWAQEAIVRVSGEAADVLEAVGRVEGFVKGIIDRSPPPATAPLDDATLDRALHLYQPPVKQFPAKGVNRWINIFDPRDPVSAEFGIGALTVADTFLSGAVPNARERAYDVTIKNEGAPPGLRAITIGAHDDRGYGKCAQLTQLIHDFWFRWSRPAQPAD